MIFLVVVLLVLLRATAGSFNSLQEKTLNDLLGDNVPKIHTTAEEGVKMYKQWAEQALSSLMAAVAEEHIKLAAAPPATAYHGRCVKTATTLRKHARCVVKLLDDRSSTRTVPQRIIYNEKTKTIQGVVRRKREIKTFPKVISKSSYSLHTSKEENAFNSITQMVTKIVRQGKGKSNRRSWRSLYSSIMKQKKKNDRSHVLSKTVLETMMASVRRKDSPTEKDKLVTLVKEGINLGMRLAGQNKTTSGIVKVASPRFLSIVPGEAELGTNVLSPNLFSLHDQGKDIEEITSLGNLLGKIDHKAPENFLEMITEVTGLTDTVEKAEAEVRQKSLGSLTNSNGTQVHISKENITALYGDQGYRTLKVMEKLHGSYTEEQTVNLNSSGYTVMNREQLQLVYGTGAPFEDLTVLKRNENITHTIVKREIRKTIRQLAAGKAAFSRRVKDYVLSPIVGIPIVNSPSSGPALVLSPVLFSPLIQSPVIFGPVILSPWLFIPLVLSPRALGPLVLSPFLFCPLILSPFLMIPTILSPGVANPFVLSPMALSPLILSPQVLTPIILSPMALSPVILTPMALSPFILSPLVLCPAVLSPSISGALILSPYALSPIIASTPIGGGILFGSPGFLS